MMRHTQRLSPVAITQWVTTKDDRTFCGLKLKESRVMNLSQKSILFFHSMTCQSKTEIS